MDLREQIDQLAAGTDSISVCVCFEFQCVSSQELRQLSEKQKVPVDLDTYIKKLANSRKRVLLVNDILHNVQVRVI